MGTSKCGPWEFQKGRKLNFSEHVVKPVILYCWSESSTSNRQFQKRLEGWYIRLLLHKLKGQAHQVEAVSHPTTCVRWSSPGFSSVSSVCSVMYHICQSLYDSVWANNFHRAALVNPATSLWRKAPYLSGYRLQKCRLRVGRSNLRRPIQDWDVWRNMLNGISIENRPKKVIAWASIWN